MGAVIIGLLVACGSGETSAETSPPLVTDAPPPSTSIPPVASSASVPVADFAAYYADNCASCHGSDRTGTAKYPALTPEALDASIDYYLDAMDDRTHVSIWSQTDFTEEQRAALMGYLSSTS